MGREYWQFDEVADIAGADYLDSVSCTSSTACEAVGYTECNGSPTPGRVLRRGDVYQGRPVWTSNGAPGIGSTGTVLNRRVLHRQCRLRGGGSIDQTGSTAQTVIAVL